MSHLSCGGAVETADVLVRETDHLPSTENVPKAIGDATAKARKSGDARDRITTRGD